MKLRRKKKSNWCLKKSKNLTDFKEISSAKVSKNDNLLDSSIFFLKFVFVCIFFKN